MAITDWPADERPRERLLKQGASSLSDAELLAIFLRVGVVGKSAVDLARELVNHFGSLQGLFRATPQELCMIKGIGDAKYVQLQAVLEMARRALEEELREEDAMTSPAAVRRYLQAKLRNSPQEIFVGLFLDTQHRVILAEELFRGTVDQTSVYPREVARRAIQLNAAAVIVAHNHPSGTARASAADEALTQQLKAGLAVLDIRLLDHLIIAGSRVVSMAEQGLM